MIIDDNDVDNYINKSFIERTGIAESVSIHKSASEAFEHLVRSIETNDILPEIIFLDIKMPGMNGFQFLENYSKLPHDFTSKCRIVMLSSSLDDSDIKKARSDLNVFVFLQKPLNVVSLGQLARF